MTIHDPLILGVRKEGTDAVCVIHVKRDTLHESVDNFLEYNKQIVADNPGTASNHPSNNAYHALLDAMNRRDQEQIAFVATYFVARHGTPEHVQGPTLLTIGKDGISCESWTKDEDVPCVH